MTGGNTRGGARLAAAAWLLISASLSAAPPPPVLCPQDPAPVQRVEVGLWLNDIHTVDFLDGSYGAEFYLWWVADDEELRPFEVFQILNGRDWTVRSVNRRVLADGSFHTSGYVSAIVNHDWDLRYFPFDRQRLRLVIETPFTASELRLVPNAEASLVSDFADVEGFRITDFGLTEHVERYETDFGFRDGAGYSFSRLVVELELDRESRRIVVMMFVGFLVANLMALLTYAVHVSMLSIRSSMSVGAIFGAVGNMYFLHREVNPAAGSLLVDRIAVVTFGGIVVALLTGIIVDRLYRWGKIGIARIVNWTIFTLVLLGSIAYLSAAIQQAAAA